VLEQTLKSPTHYLEPVADRFLFAQTRRGNAGLPVPRLKEAELSTTADDRTRDDLLPRQPARQRVGVDETKAAFKTTEFMAYLATVAGVLIASAVDDGIDARLAWILVAALGIGYVLSRGLAKSGTNHREGADTI
jgi:hypothetical protein